MAELMSLAALAQSINAQYHGADIPFQGVSTDSRSLKRGELFVALRGPNFDGHMFLEQVVNSGAAAVMVDQASDILLPQIQVEDTRLGLGRLASAWRSQFQLPLIAVTGSNGKTTVKEMLASIMAQRGAVLATQGNLNNDIGVPLTLLRLRPEHQSAVIEMGANHHGEIAYLTGLAKPTVALITNAGAAHLEGFGSIEGVAHAKGEIYQGLGESGIAIVNADDTYAGLWRELNSERRIISFGLEQPADVSATWKSDAQGNRLQVRTPEGEFSALLALPGQHNVMNALAATAAAIAAGATPQQCAAGLEAMQPVAGRLQTKVGEAGAKVIDDTYNANPSSLQVALDVLMLNPGRRFLVLGDMGELGGDAKELHGDMGRKAREAGVDVLLAVGELSSAAVAAFGDDGRHFANQEQLITALHGELAADVTVLIKGSRRMHMERVVAALLDEGRGEA